MQCQAWLFWEYATKLLEGGSNVVEVSFECPGVRSFDDIVVRHDPPRQESLSDRIQMVHVQAKYHVGPGAFTIAAMTEPAFIGADKVPLLGLLGEAYRRIGAEDYMRRRFWIVSPWPMHPEDKQLLELWRDNTSSFRLDVLRRGTNRSSRWVRLRAIWRDALGISNDDELYAILSRLRINASQGDLNGRFANYISAVLRGVGLKGIDPTRADDPYGQIPWGLHAEGETRFTKEKLEAVADQYELWGTGRQPPPPGRRLGVRTAVRWGEQMESTTAAYLPLEEHFDGRFIHDETAWPNLYTTLRVFLRDQVSRGGPHLLEVGAVATIAFAAGYALPAKDGLPVHPIQRRRDGADVWDAAVPDASPGGWSSATCGPCGENVGSAGTRAGPIGESSVRKPRRSRRDSATRSGSPRKRRRSRCVSSGIDIVKSNSRIFGRTLSDFMRSVGESGNCSLARMRSPMQ